MPSAILAIQDNPIFRAFRTYPWLDDVLATALLLMGIVLMRMVLVHRVKNGDFFRSQEVKRRWLVTIRNVCAGLLLLGLVIIWGSELRTMALSLVAFMVAMVLATKELILCFTGGLLKTGARAFSVGDRIEIAGLRGDVIDQSVLTTKLLETGPGLVSHQHTGRAVTIPNSMFLASPVINETFTSDYVLHIFTVPVANEPDWKQKEAWLLEAAQEICWPFLEDARRHIGKIGSREGLGIPAVDPRVIVERPAPARSKGRVEQHILQKSLDHTHGQDVATE
jgi:small-conductance mechanosensitive channel